MRWPKTFTRGLGRRRREVVLTEEDVREVRAHAGVGTIYRIAGTKECVFVLLDDDTTGSVYIGITHAETAMECFWSSRNQRLVDPSMLSTQGRSEECAEEYRAVLTSRWGLQERAT